MKQLNIAGKSIVISGATGALGGSIAEHLLQNGAQVILLGRSLSKLKGKAEDLFKKTGVKVTYRLVDLLDKKALKKTCDQLLTQVDAFDGWSM